MSKEQEPLNIDMELARKIKVIGERYNWDLGAFFEDAKKLPVVSTLPDPSHLELLDAYQNECINGLSLERLAELRSLILGKMVEGEKLSAELEQWKTWCIVEIAVRNPQVAEYCEHWEGRATKAESELEEAKRLVRVAENAFQLQDAFSVEGRAGELNGLQIAKAWLALEKRAEAAEARLAAQPDLAEALRNVVDAAHRMLMEMQNAANSPRIEYWNEQIVGIAHSALEAQVNINGQPMPYENNLATGVNVASASHTPRCPKGQIAKDEICGEIQDIMAVYREQDASYYGVDTPGGLEHMGDVWKLLREWDRKLSTRARECEFCYDILPSHKSNCRLANENSGLATAILTELGDALGLNLEMHSERVLAIIRERKPLAQFFPVTSSQGAVCVRCGKPKEHVGHSGHNSMCHEFKAQPTPGPKEQE